MSPSLLSRPCPCFGNTYVSGVKPRVALRRFRSPQEHFIGDISIISPLLDIGLPAYERHSALSSAQLYATVLSYLAQPRLLNKTVFRTHQVSSSALIHTSYFSSWRRSRALAGRGPLPRCICCIGFDPLEKPGNFIRTERLFNLKFTFLVNQGSNAKRRPFCRAFMEPHKYLTYYWTMQYWREIRLGLVNDVNSTVFLK